MDSYIPTFYINWIFKKKQKAENTKPQAFKWITHRAPWIVTYLHLILTIFSKKAKTRKHLTLTGKLEKTTATQTQEFKKI